MLTVEQEDLITRSELTFRTSRSGGKGGQNVNKVETKVEIAFDIEGSKALTEKQKEVLKKRHPGLVVGTTIKMTESGSRSQLMNKESAIRKLFASINKTLRPVKKRLATKPGKGAKEKKLKDKKLKSEKKSLRQKLR